MEGRGLRRFFTPAGALGVAVDPKRKRIALLIAAASDLAQLALPALFSEGAFSPVEGALDAATALLMLLTLGFSWRLTAAFVTELVPGLDLFPTWTAVVLSLPTTPRPPELASGAQLDATAARGAKEKAGASARPSPR